MEADKPGKLAERMAGTKNVSLREHLPHQPIFCMETALAMHRWSQVAYGIDKDDKVSQTGSTDDDHAELVSAGILVADKSQGEPSTHF